jgi:UDP-2,3-diacylglucosamine pyrophosphatase LpxH
MPAPAPFTIPARKKEITPSAETSIVVMSDMHRGDGTGSDDFAHNSLIFKCALDYYLERNFTFIELGDAEELWENKAFAQIYITHTSIYDRLREFHDPDPDQTRYIKIWGNHDLLWQGQKSRPLLDDLFPGIGIYECAILNGPSRFLLLHGHQFDPTCHGAGGHVTKFFVRHFWGRLQRCGFKDPTRAANNPGKSNKLDDSIYQWAKTNHYGIHTVIAGHTHRPVYENLSLTERRLQDLGVGTRGIRKKRPADPAYFNTGSCVHPRCITGIEITFKNQKPTLQLIKWAHEAQAVQQPKGSDPPVAYDLIVKRSVLA